jgi:hypothetical protein
MAIVGLNEAQVLYNRPVINSFSTKGVSNHYMALQVNEINHFRLFPRTTPHLKERSFRVYVHSVMYVPTGPDARVEVNTLIDATRNQLGAYLFISGSGVVKVMMLEAVPRAQVQANVVAFVHRVSGVYPNIT